MISTLENLAAGPEAFTVSEVLDPNYLRTLTIVRELSENATLRPAPNKLRCLPLQTFALQPIPAWKRQRIALIELAAALARQTKPN